jgi:hypothetical protein
MLWYLFQAGQQATKHNHTHVSGHLTPTWLQHLSTTRSFVDHRKPAPGSWPQQLSSHQLLLFRRVCPDVPSVWRVITGRRSARRGGAVFGLPTSYGGARTCTPAAVSGRDAGLRGQATQCLASNRSRERAKESTIGAHSDGSPRRRHITRFNLDVVSA